MLDSISVDQLRTFVAAVDEGSFSAAGRRLRRAQSVVSQTLAAMEERLGLKLFDRTKRLPVLTNHGRALLPEARAAVVAMDLFKAKSRGLSDGLEPEVAITVDVMFPIDLLTAAVAEFQTCFPDTPLRLFIEALGAVLQPVLDGKCAFGIAGPIVTELPLLKTEPLQGVPMCVAVAPDHPLAAHGTPVPFDVVAEQVQLVLTDRSSLTLGREFGVLSSRTWRIADLGAKHAFLRAGLGWGAMPRATVARDLASGELIEVVIAGLDPASYLMPMHAVYPAAKPPGPAGRWLLERLKNADVSPEAMGSIP
jgi:DNA-binding transcriptional LysR family regulator